MHVMIDNVHYVPWNQQTAVEPGWSLTAKHLEAAKEWPEWFDMLAWAIECQATVAEMKAYRRAGQPDLEPEPKKKVEPLPVPARKPVKSLFES